MTSTSAEDLENPNTQDLPGIQQDSIRILHGSIKVAIGFL